ncbi:unnamed protein product [Calypogeia fissa]
MRGGMVVEDGMDQEPSRHIVFGILSGQVKLNLWTGVEQTRRSREDPVSTGLTSLEEIVSSSDSIARE